MLYVIDTMLLPPETGPEMSMWGFAQADGRFTRFISAIEGTAVMYGLRFSEAIDAVLAPTDEAFANLPANVAEFLENDPFAMEFVVTFHLLAPDGWLQDADLTTADMAGMAEIPTKVPVHGGVGFGFEKLAVNSTEEGLRIGEALVITGDTDASNGMLYVIDTMLLPPESGPEMSMWGVLQADGRFTTFLAALEGTNLMGNLRFSEAIDAVLAPTDEAFANLPAESQMGRGAAMWCLLLKMIQHLPFGVFLWVESKLELSLNWDRRDGALARWLAARCRFNHGRSCRNGRDFHPGRRGRQRFWLWLRKAAGYPHGRGAADWRGAGNHWRYGRHQRQKMCTPSRFVATVLIPGSF